MGLQVQIFAEWCNCVISSIMLFECFAVCINSLSRVSSGCLGLPALCITIFTEDLVADANELYQELLDCPSSKIGPVVITENVRTTLFNKLGTTTILHRKAYNTVWGVFNDLRQSDKANSMSRDSQYRLHISRLRAYSKRPTIIKDLSFQETLCKPSLVASNSDFHPRSLSPNSNQARYKQYEDTSDASPDPKRSLISRVCCTPNIKPLEFCFLAEYECSITLLHEVEGSLNARLTHSMAMRIEHLPRRT